MNAPRRRRFDPLDTWTKEDDLLAWRRLGAKGDGRPQPASLPPARIWTKLDDERLRELRARGVQVKIICRRLGRSEASVEKRISEIARSERKADPNLTMQLNVPASIFAEIKAEAAKRGISASRMMRDLFKAEMAQVAAIKKRIRR